MRDLTDHRQGPDLATGLFASGLRLRRGIARRKPPIAYRAALVHVYNMQKIIVRRTRDDVADKLVELITNGELAGGERLEEVDLSRQMGVSRTPIREALIALEGQGWVDTVPNRGVKVAVADQRMVAEIYPILAALEAEALRLSAPSLKDSVARLRALNGKLATEHRRERQHALDKAFHGMLVERCGNGRLLRLIESYWRLAARFDGAADRGSANRQGSCREHETIIAAVEAGQIDEAADRLRQHWHDGIEVVSQWLAR